jgi:hypothetical protein
VTAERVVSTCTKDASKSSTGEPNNDKSSHDETSASPANGLGIGSLVIPGSIVEVVSCKTVAAADEAANNDGEPTAEETATSYGEPTVKKEKDLILKQALKHRKYGNRVLLARQAKNGMLKMGGGMFL